jgi:hypothetical protein
MRDHPGWRVWYVPNALDGSVTWCAQREPTIHAYSTEDLGKDMALADAELAAEGAGRSQGPAQFFDDPGRAERKQSPGPSRRLPRNG